MPITFNLLLREQGIDPKNVRLLRHETKQYRGLTPYSLWRDDPIAFERYQSTQPRHRQAWFRAAYWASFVVPPDGSTLLVGLFSSNLRGPVPAGWRHPLNDEPLSPDLDDLYDTVRQTAMQEYSSVLTINWGSGTRSWIQLAANQDKRVIELKRAFKEEAFPGFASFITQLSDLPRLPATWRSPLAAAKGVYLLTCPRTHEQYVGSATGADGFWGRWQAYWDGGSGGNVGLQSRNPADYQVSVLQVAGSADSLEHVLAAEQLWKRKLQAARWV